jgi:hypothetical protein
MFKAFHWKSSLLSELPSIGLLGQYTNALGALSPAGAHGQDLAARQRGYPQPEYIVVDRNVLPLAAIPTSV